ncbi:MAG: uracil-DNA glycosylase, partial [Candidatus Cloacimonadota bacterium]|nr:uracil-DNA glycosylase [Candidatus Cloacimonadota bacterium]
KTGEKIEKEKTREIFKDEGSFKSTGNVNNFKTIDNEEKFSLQLSELNKKYEHCTSCVLSETRHKFVFGEGNSQADIMFIAEAPGADEDKIGKPFVGKAGKLFDKMLLAVNLDRKKVYITNVVKCRPPKNRNPKIEEIEKCLPCLLQQISIIKPKIICALGKVAGNTLLQGDNTLGEMRAKFYPFNDSLVMVTYHPSALLYQNKWKRPTWEDLKMLRKKYQELGIN